MMARREFHTNSQSGSRGASTLLLPVCLMLLSAALLPPSGADANPLTPPEKRGRLIYTKTVSPAGREIKAAVGKEGKELMNIPGNIVPCVNCHAYNGIGRPEGGVNPVTITWAELTKPYRVKFSTGRERPPYTEAGVARAITEGLDLDGNMLDIAMPRYTMAKEDMADLIAYLKRLGGETEPGITERAVTIGTLIPSQGPLAEAGRAAKALLTAFFKELNDAGGIFHRTVELRVEEFPGSPSSLTEAARRMISSDEVFALTGAFTAGAESAVAELAESAGVPLVGPYTPLTPEGSELQRFSFYVFSSLLEQTEAFLSYARNGLKLENPRIAVLANERTVPAAVYEALDGQCKAYGWPPLLRRTYPEGQIGLPRLTDQLDQDAPDLIIFFGPGEDLRLLLRRFAGTGRGSPRVFLPGSWATPDILTAPAAFGKKIFLSYPTQPSDQTAAGAQEFAALRDKYGLPKKYVAAQLSAYASAKILVEGLKRSGKDLNNERFVTALEKLYAFDTGLTPKITYGPNRRTGAAGAYIVSVDLEKRNFVPVSGWIAVGE